jgi:hypothetical protein
MTDEGHVYYPYGPLIVKCKEVLDIDREVIVKALGAQEVTVTVDDRRISMTTAIRMSWSTATPYPSISPRDLNIRQWSFPFLSSTIFCFNGTCSIPE